MKEIKRTEYINLSIDSELQQRITTGPGKYTRLEKATALEKLIKFTELVDQGISMQTIDNEDLIILEKVFEGLYHYKNCNEDS